PDAIVDCLLSFRQPCGRRGSAGMLCAIGANQRVKRGFHAPVADLRGPLMVGADDRELDVLEHVFVLLLERGGHGGSPYQRSCARYSWIARNAGRGLPSALRMPKEACSWRG